MARRFGQVHIKRHRGKMIVQGMSKTPRGTRFISGTVDLGTKRVQDPEFKSKLEQAVAKLYS